MTLEHVSVGVVLAVIGVSLLYLVGAVVWMLWLDHEEQHAEAEQRRWLDVIHRTPAPFSEKASQGWEQRRR